MTLDSFARSASLTPKGIFSGRHKSCNKLQGTEIKWVPALPLVLCFRDSALHSWLVSPSFTLSCLFLPFSAIASEHGSSPPTQRQIHTESPLQSSRMSLTIVLI